MLWYVPFDLLLSRVADEHRQVPLGQNLHKTAGPVTDGTYIAFIVLMFCGFILANFLIDPKRIIRDDGSHIILVKHPSWQSEFRGLFETFRTDPYIICLFPMFFGSNWFYTYQFNGVNAAHFNTRTRALNNVLYWGFQIVGSALFGFSLDSKLASRKVKARVVLAILFVYTMVLWGGSYDYQKGYTRASVKAPDFVLTDFNGPHYVAPMFLYIFYGIYDAAWQTTLYW